MSDIPETNGGVGEIVAGKRPELAFRSSEGVGGHQEVRLPLERDDLSMTVMTQIANPDGEVVRPLAAEQQVFEAVHSTGNDLLFWVAGDRSMPGFSSRFKAGNGWRYSTVSEVTTSPLVGTVAEGFRPRHVFEVPLSELDMAGLAESLMRVGDGATYAVTEDLREVETEPAHIGIAMYGVDISNSGIVVSSENDDSSDKQHLVTLTAEDNSSRSGVDIYMQLNEATDRLTITIDSSAGQLTSKVNSRLLYTGVRVADLGKNLRDYEQTLINAFPGRINYKPFQERSVSPELAEAQRRYLEGYRPERGAFDWPEIPWKTLGKIGGVVAVLALLSVLRSCDFDINRDGPSSKGQQLDLLSCVATGFEVPGDFSERISNMTPDEFTESLRRQGMSPEDAATLQELAGVVLSIDGEPETSAQLNALRALGVIADYAQDMESGTLLEEKTGVLVSAICQINRLPFDKSFTVEANGPWLLSALEDLDTEHTLSRQQREAIVRLLMAVRNPAEIEPSLEGNPAISDWQGVTAENTEIVVSTAGQISIQRK